MRTYPDQTPAAHWFDPELVDSGWFDEAMPAVVMRAAYSQAAGQATVTGTLGGRAAGHGAAVGTGTAAGTFTGTASIFGAALGASECSAWIQILAPRLAVGKSAAGETSSRVAAATLAGTESATRLVWSISSGNCLADETRGSLERS